MDVVFEGSLSKSWGMADVLQAIVDVPNVPFGLLRISSPTLNFHGKILITDCSHIVGATCSESIEGSDPYDAVRTVLGLKEGNFAFLDLAAESADDIDRALFINLRRVIEKLPQLPDKGSIMFDERRLLDKIFGADPLAPVPQGNTPTFQLPVSIPKNRMRSKPNLTQRKIMAAPPITQWNVVEPLFNNPQASHADNAECVGLSIPDKSSMIPGFVQTPEEQRSTLNKLRALPEPKMQGWQKVLKDTTQTFLSALGLD